MFNNRYSKDLLSSYFIILLNILIPIVLTPFLLNKLGAEQYGLWVLLTSILIYFQLSNFGMTTTFLKDISNENLEVNKSTYINTIFFFLLAIVSFLVLPFFIIYFNLSNFFKISQNLVEMSKVVFLYLFLLFSINLVGSIFDNILFSQKKLFIKNIIVICTSLVTTILTIILLIYNYSLVEIAQLQLFVAFINVSCYYLYSKKLIDFKISLSQFNFNLLKDMIKPSFYYFIIGISIMISFYSDTIVISTFIGAGAVTTYAIGYKVVNIVEKIIFKIVDILFPDISRLNSEKKYDELLKKHNKLQLITLSIAFVSYLSLILIGENLITIWVGSEYVLDMNIFYFFIAFAFIHTWNHVSSVFIMAMNLHKEVAYLVVLEAILNVLLSVLLLKYYGLIGVAMGTFFAHLITNNWFPTFWFYRNIRKSIRIKEGLKSE